MTQLKIGAALATRIEESYEPNFNAVKFFPDWDPAVLQEHAEWLSPAHYDPASGFLKLSVHSWLLTVGGKRILIDACVGNHKPRAARPMWHMQDTKYLERLAAAGARPEDIDMDPEPGPANLGSFRDSVLPVVEAGLAQLVSGAAALDEHLAVEPAPGHTPGTIAIKFESRGERALFCGDILHHALQVYRPQWNSFACAHAENARKSRHAALEHCAGGALLMPAHFGAPFACHIDHKGDGFTPRFVG